MRKLVLSLLSITVILGSSSAFAQSENEQIVVANRKNDEQQQKKPYLILISADGFRHDYIEKHQASFLSELSRSGVRAEALIPSFPSVTFPNHYTIVTGLYPSHHGLVGNNMYDPKIEERYSLRNAKAVLDPAWYGGTPIWALAEQQKMLTACYYWPGSEAAIQGVLPTYYYPYSEKIHIDKRIEEVVKWLRLPEADRPHLITFYFPEVDHAGHTYGPDAPETKAAVQYIDASVKSLVKAVGQTGIAVNYMFVADHGMTAINQEQLLKLPMEVNPEEMVVVSGGVYMSLFVKDADKIQQTYQEILAAKAPHYQVYLKTEVPEKYHFGAKDDYFGRIGDIVLIADSPYYFSNHKASPGAHGYDPYQYPDMNATFMAWGPQIKPNTRVEKFENIHIYPLMTTLLDLNHNNKIDGDDRMVKQILK
ncbi:ectonucleotide pyrophosphatase/phosphodiesterase [Flavobacterium sp. HSC-61S13]|uniref:alkaline phosphatase family protein n=1 Tax=Flavobacterium sp. HSC-61S13 TaxID=2910963 RepID=UPI00209C9EDD|nr:ectonucleotide pyrophosphatase/phosphodiesterase [Flavobacterium sp. HSC-61S13]MCP1995057.1 putative AlkP superfamily pyrophosphatase or phosphodiesterase [Flavobacterium sp. HSC-61S13]